MEHKVQLFNTLTRKVECFVPNEEGKVGMYTCGPTVYHFAHIGNLRSYLMEDVLEKTFRYVGYEVKRVMNITDVGHLSSDADTGEDVKGGKAGKQNGNGTGKVLHRRFFCRLRQIKYQNPGCRGACDIMYSGIYSYD